MTEDEYFAAVREIRKAGYAIAIFTPDEMGNIDSGSIEDAMTAAGNDCIEHLSYLNEE
jgi:acetyl-CoA acetyltransferase